MSRRATTPGGQRDAEAGGEDQALRPVALLGQQDAPEPRKPHQHRRQDRDNRHLDHQRRQQELLGRERLGFVRHGRHWSAELVSIALPELVRCSGPSALIALSRALG